MKKLGILLVFVIILLFDFIFIYLYNKEKSLNIKENNLILKIKYENEILKNMLIEHVLYCEEFEFNLNYKITNKFGKEMLLKDITDGSPKLILRFTDQCCEACFESEIEKLKILSNSIDGKDIILLVSSSSKNYCKILNDIYKINFEVYSCDINNNLFPKSLNELKLPFYFLIDKDYKSKLIYIPDKAFPEITQEYYSALKNYFSILNQPFENSRMGISFFKTTIDLGKCIKKQKYISIFSFVNNMNTPIIISNIETSCGCTIAKFEQKPIQPGEKSKIEVEFNANEKGAFTKSIMVFSNANNELVKLLIRVCL
jgi:hypothetical protein